VIVVDASIVLAWVLPGTEAGQRHAARIAEAAISGTEVLAAPRLLVTECSYRLLKYGRTHRWGEAKVAECAEFIDAFGLRYYDNTNTLAGVARFAVHHSAGLRRGVPWARDAARRAAGNTRRRPALGSAQRAGGFGAGPPAHRGGMIACDVDTPSHSIFGTAQTRV
jgi:predicted nucleic acid-binding protein